MLPGGSGDILAASAPLAEKLRPRVLADFIGQEHLIGDGSLLLSLVESRAIGSMILWGPPGWASFLFKYYRGI